MDKYIRLISYYLGFFLDFLRYRILPYHNNRYPHARSIHNKYMAFLAQHLPDLSLQWKTILDIGSGNMVLQGILFYLEDHIKKYIYSEPFMYFSREKNLRIAYNELEKEGIDTKNIFLTPEKLDPEIFEFNTDFCSRLEHISDESIDIVLSNAVFEHIQAKDLEPTTQAMWRVLKPGGYMIHEIDLRDHQYYFHRDYAFYKYSFEEWDELTRIANYSVFWSNRLRSRDFSRAFSEKFVIKTVTTYKKEMHESVDLAKVHPDLVQKYTPEELDEQVVLIICQKT